MSTLIIYLCVCFPNAGDILLNISYRYMIGGVFIGGMGESFFKGLSGPSGTLTNLKPDFLAYICIHINIYTYWYIYIYICIYIYVYININIYIYIYYKYIYVIFVIVIILLNNKIVIIIPMDEKYDLS
jgi:hypothetical protein